MEESIGFAFRLFGGAAILQASGPVEFLGPSSM